MLIQTEPLVQSFQIPIFDYSSSRSLMDSFFDLELELEIQQQLAMVGESCAPFTQTDIPVDGEQYGGGNVAAMCVIA